MPDTTALPDVLGEGPPLAFVIRLRGGNARSLVIEVDDVQGARTWRDTSLDGAFDRIRLAIVDYLAHRARGPQGPTGKPN